MHPRQKLTAVLSSGNVLHADLIATTAVVIAPSDFAQEAIDEARRRGHSVVFLDPNHLAAVHITTPNKNPDADSVAPGGNPKG